MSYFTSLIRLVRQRQNALQSFHRHRRLFRCQTQISNGQHLGAVCSKEPQLDLGLDLLLICHLRVMDERSPAGARRLVARGGVLEAFNDGGLSAAIVADYDGHRREELDHCNLLVVEGPDSTNCEFVQVCHCTDNGAFSGGRRETRFV